jgi:hypothetical protein
LTVEYTTSLIGFIKERKYDKRKIFILKQKKNNIKNKSNQTVVSCRVNEGEVDGV